MNVETRRLRPLPAGTASTMGIATMSSDMPHGTAARAAHTLEIARTEMSKFRHPSAARTLSSAGASAAWGAVADAVEDLLHAPPAHTDAKAEIAGLLRDAHGLIGYNPSPEARFRIMNATRALRRP